MLLQTNKCYCFKQIDEMDESEIELLIRREVEGAGRLAVTEISGMPRV